MLPTQLGVLQILGNPPHMKITPLGAAGGEVTGSAYLVETDHCAVLVDCGLFQGTESEDDKNRSFDPQQLRKLCSVLLTHAHLDHCGRLPLLHKAGYTGKILATPATIDLAGLILRDAAKIQANDIERANRKRARTGEEPLPPLYTPEDVEATLKLFEPVRYREPIPVAPGIRAIFAESGHMLGSASIQLLVQEGDAEKIVVFSGDLGPRTAPILKEYDPFERAHLVFLESTYGNRDHRPFKETTDEFLRILREASDKHGKILVPTFAVGRAQLLLSLLAYFFRHKLVEPFPIYLDSPMAIEANKIYDNHQDLFDEEILEFLSEGKLSEQLPSLNLSVTADDSKKINDISGPCLVLAGAGMCHGGRIVHHLRANLGKPDTHVVIVGFQGHGTLGRLLVDGVPEVKLFGEQIAVKAKVHTLGGFSAHAGQTDLLIWLEKLVPRKPRVALTHGEDGPRDALAKMIRQKFGLEVQLPEFAQAIEL